MAKRRKKAAAEAPPAASVQDKIAGCLALIAVRGLDPEDAALRLDGIGFSAAEIAGLLSVNENYVRVAKFRKKKSADAMGRINQDLLDAIIAKTGSSRTAYRRIQKVQHDTFLERDLAALVVGAQLHISINRYSTAQQRGAIRGHITGGGASGPAAAPPAAAAPSPARGRNGKAPKPRKRDNSVFVINGRDQAVTDSMYALLDALGCKPVEFHQAVAKVRGTGNPFIGDVLDRAFEQVQALVVLFTPDDEAKLKDHFLKKGGDAGERKLRGQPRPNVIFEAGMAMARHEEKTIMVQVGAMKPFSDISGRHMVHLGDDYDSRLDFATRLGKKCKVDTTGTRWTKVGKFVPTAPKKKARR